MHEILLTSPENLILIGEALRVARFTLHTPRTVTFTQDGSQHSALKFSIAESKSPNNKLADIIVRIRTSGMTNTGLTVILVPDLNAIPEMNLALFKTILIKRRGWLEMDGQLQLVTYGGIESDLFFALFNALDEFLIIKRNLTTGLTRLAQNLLPE